MTRYCVTIVQNLNKETEVIVEADNEELAEILALACVFEGGPGQITGTDYDPTEDGYVLEVDEVSPDLNS